MDKDSYIPAGLMSGAASLLKEHPLDTLALLFITSTNPYYEESMMSLRRAGIYIPEERTYFYRPPGTVGVKKNLTNLKRTELIPTVDHGLTFIIADKYVDSGRTMACAANSCLVPQGIALDEIWFYTPGVEGTDWSIISADDYIAGFMDKVSKLFRFKRI